MVSLVTKENESFSFQLLMFFRKKDCVIQESAVKPMAEEWTSNGCGKIKTYIYHTLRDIWSTDMHLIVTRLLYLALFSHKTAFITYKSNHRTIYTLLMIKSLSMQLSNANIQISRKSSARALNCHICKFTSKLDINYYTLLSYGFISQFTRLFKSKGII